MLLVEIDNENNQNYAFPPLQRVLRGRLDFSRDDRENAPRKADIIPGKRIRLDGNKATIEEPLWDEENEALRLKFEKEYKIPENESLEVDGNTWAYWLQRAIEGGHAVILDGKLPRVDASAATTQFLNPPAETETDRLAEAIENQTKVFEKLLEKLAK